MLPQFYQNHLQKTQNLRSFRTKGAVGYSAPLNLERYWFNSGNCEQTVLFYGCSQCQNIDNLIVREITIIAVKPYCKWLAVEGVNTGVQMDFTYYK